MFGLHVLGQVEFLVVAFAANIADMDFRVLGLPMPRYVREQIRFQFERQVTRIALVRPATLVRSHMRPQIGLL